MNLPHKFVAVVVASLLAGGPSPAKIAPLGIVMHAERAHVGEAEASTGSTIFEGERLSTEEGGILRINIPALTLQLGGQSAMVIGRANGQQNNLVELTYGTLVFSAAPTGGIVVTTNEARVRPATSVPTMAQVWVMSRRELRIYAERGALEFSYHGESATIPEGKNCRIVLDPSEKEMAASESGQGPHPPWNHHRTFILVAIAVAVAVGIAIPVIINSYESPDSPGSSLARKP